MPDDKAVRVRRGQQCFGFQRKNDHARIEFNVDGNTYTTRVSTDGYWRDILARDLVTLPAGEQTIRLAVPKGGGGWALNSFTLQRA